jgi:hypothetical protein
MIKWGEKGEEYEERVILLYDCKGDGFDLFDSDGFGKVSREININTFQDSKVIRK